LKRLFLSDTQLTTEGAIALAEFLPESKTLLHFDLTENPLVETAGIMALAVGLKANTLLRCLDLSIPPNNPELAELSQSILQSCVRNTELAAARASAPEAVWAPIKKSALVRQVKQADDLRAEREREIEASSPEGIARERVYTLAPERLFDVGVQIVRELEGSYSGVTGSEPFVVQIETARALRERLVETIDSTVDPDGLARMLELNDALTVLIDKKDSYQPPPRIKLPSEVVATPSPPRPRRHMRIPSVEISSPNFSLGDSDGESDAEELQVQDVVEETSRRMVEEEGEIFRKGVKLGVVKDESESGEQLRQEVSYSEAPYTVSCR
jgi:protein phosphatase 1 regulatory subunit 37